MERKRRRVRGHHEIDVEDIAADPRPGMAAPTSIAFSADDRYIAYLMSKPGARDQHLMVNAIGADGQLSPATPFVRQGFEQSLDESSLTLEERMRRERTRTWGHGITWFAWGAQSSCVVLQQSGSVFLQRGPEGELQLLVAAEAEDDTGTRGPVIDPKLSPNEKLLAFVRRSELWLLPVPPPSAPAALCAAEAAAAVCPGRRGRKGAAADTNATAEGKATDSTQRDAARAAAAATSAPLPRAVQLTEGASATISHGLADYCAQEEMHRYEGFWWSPDSEWIAFQETDDSPVTEFTIVHHSEASALARETHRYPFSGGANARVRIGIVAARCAPGEEGAGGGGRAAQPVPCPLWLDLGIADSAWTSGTWAESGAADRPAAGAAPARKGAAAAKYGSSGYDRFDDGYVTEVRWAGRQQPAGGGASGGGGGSGALFVQVQDRRQQTLRLLRFAPPGPNGEWRLGGAERARGAAGVLAGTVVLQERSSTWLNLNGCLRALSDGSIVWGSERSGFLHLYTHSPLGECVAPLTEGAWVVDSVLGVDEDKGRIFFSAALPDPRQKNLYSAPLRRRGAQAGGPPEPPVRLTSDDGWHEVALSHSHGLFADVFSSVSEPYRVSLHSLADGSRLATLFQNADPRLSPLSLATPRLTSLRNRHGDELHGALFTPPSSFPKPWPLLVVCYGGPEIQIATNAWGLSAAMREQFFAQEGFLVLRLDGRGSSRRGKAFELPLFRNMGHAEVEDQADGVRCLTAEGLADASRVGVIGWSYGGYLALLCLARAPDVFHAAVAGAPVTHWDGYDTHYTERYMGLPSENAAGYINSSVMAHVDAISDSAKLLLVHGLLDENVHFRHTARLIDELIKCRKRYELLLFPNERHTPRRHSDRVYMEERIFHFFQAALLSGAKGRGAADS